MTTKFKVVAGIVLVTVLSSFLVFEIVVYQYVKEVL